MALVLLPIASAVLCQDTLTSGSNCTMLTPALTCANYTYSIYNTNGTATTHNGTLTSLNESIYYLTFNETQVGGYITKLCDATTREINVVGFSNMLETIIALIFFAVLFLVLVFLFQPLEIKIILFMAVMGFAWVIYGLILELATSSGATANVIRILTAGYRMMVYTFLTIFALSLLYLFYRMIMLFVTLHKTKL